MTVAIIRIGISLIILEAEACFIMPDKMPWNKGKKDKK